MRVEIEKQELDMWKRRITRKSSRLQRVSKRAQTKMNTWIPEKAHNLITDSIRRMVEITLNSGGWLPMNPVSAKGNLQEREQSMKERLEFYRKTATIEGAGTGAGGLFLGMADFPLLLSIKMKFLTECSIIHSYDVNVYEERLFLLYVFQLAFSSDDHKRKTLSVIEDWNAEKERVKDMDWRTFQQEYRDHIDLIKMLQLVPGIGAVVGAYANYQLLDQLGETAKFAYRIRHFHEHEKG